MKQEQLSYVARVDSKGSGRMKCRIYRLDRIGGSKVMLLRSKRGMKSFGISVSVYNEDIIFIG